GGGELGRGDRRAGTRWCGDRIHRVAGDLPDQRAVPRDGGRRGAAVASGGQGRSVLAGGRAGTRAGRGDAGGDAAVVGRCRRRCFRDRRARCGGAGRIGRGAGDGGAATRGTGVAGGVVGTTFGVGGEPGADAERSRHHGGAVLHDADDAERDGVLAAADRVRIRAGDTDRVAAVAARGRVGGAYRRSEAAVDRFRHRRHGTVGAGVHRSWRGYVLDRGSAGACVVGGGQRVVLCADVLL